MIYAYAIDWFGNDIKLYCFFLRTRIIDFYHKSQRITAHP